MRLSFVPALAALLTLSPTIAGQPESTSTAGLSVVNDDGSLLELPLRHTKVSIEVSAFVARATVEQVYVNPFESTIEVVYTFPLGHESAVDEFEMRVADRVIRGEVRRRQEARESYEAAKAEGRQAALLEQGRPDVFTQSIANLPPAGEVAVRIRTVEVLKYEAGVYQLTFPLVVGPRYVPPGWIPAEGGPIDAPTLPPGTRSGHDVDIEVALDAGVPLHEVTSPSHDIEVLADGPARAQVGLRPHDCIPNKDFVLRWSVAADEPAVGVLTHRQGVDGYFAFIIQPRGTVDIEDAAPKEVLFVLDTSGSMRGVPLERSKAFVHSALASLGRRDTFNVIQFASGSSTFSESSLDTTYEHVQDALLWVDGLQGSGGTEMLGGLERAVAQHSDSNRYRMIVVLTDGYIGDESEILSRAQRLPDDVRVFTIGIGSSVNHSLLEGMAEIGGGAYTFIPADKDGAIALERFRGWVLRPYLTDLELDWGALPVGDWIPELPRDLFSGQNLTVIGRYHGAADGAVALRGRLAGAHWETEVPIRLPEVEARNAALASIWARGRIRTLLAASPAEVSDGVREEVTELALEFNLMSPYTSFVAVDDVVVNPDGACETVEQPVPLPDGVSFEEPELFERVTVFAATAVVDLEQAASATHFSDRFVHDLPVPGRFYTNVLSLAPGVQDADGDGSPHVHGSRSRDFQVIVAGASSMDPLRGQWVSRLDANSIEEMRVITAGASVEFGRAQGGFAQIVHKQGANAHEGRLGVEGGSDALDGLGGRTIPASYGSFRGGLHFSGPVVRDRLWYRLTHEWIDRSDPLGTGSSAVVLPQHSASHSDLLTWQVSPRSKLQLGLQWQEDDVEHLGASSFVGVATTPGLDQAQHTLAVTWTVPHSPRILVQTIVSHTATEFARAPIGAPTLNGCISTTDPSLASAECLDLVGGVQSGTPHRRIDEASSRFALTSKVVFFAGRRWGASHQLRIGTDFGIERLDRELQRAPNLIRTADGSTELLLARAAGLADTAADGGSLHWALYGEDQLKPRQNLTVTLGLRADGERIEADGFSPFDPRAELEAFVAAAGSSSGAQRAAIAGQTFTGPEDAQEFLVGLADQLGPVVGPEPTEASRVSERARLEDWNLSPFFSVKWDPWSNGRAAFSLALRRYYDRLLPAYALLESEPATADVLVDAGAPAVVRPSIQVVDRALETPYQDEWKLAFEREIFAETKLSTVYVHRTFERQVQLTDVNHAPGDFGCADSGSSPDGVLDDCDSDGLADLYVQSPLWGDVFLLDNDGEGTYEGWTLELDRHHYRSWEMRGSYTYSVARWSAEEFDPLIGDERTLLETREGFQSYDQRHVFKLHGTVTAPHGFRVGGSLAWESGLPYATLEQRIVHDAIPPALAGLTESVPLPRLIYATPTRNFARNDAFLNLDLRLAHEALVGSRVMLLWRIDVLNVLDDQSYRIHPGERAYGRSIDGFDDAIYRFGRRYQVGVELSF